MSHAVVRTSPKGEPFLGACKKCGEENLTMREAMKPCPMDKLVSDEQALLDILDENK